MSVEELLLALKDIQPPPQPEWWQIAPIWWVLLVFFLALVLGVYIIKTQRKNNRLVNLAEAELAQIIRQNMDKRLLALDLSAWLKRVALLAFPDQQLESISGTRWLGFLDQCMGKKHFRHGPGQVFGGSIYAQNIDTDLNELARLCEQWLSAIKPHLQRRGRI